MLIVDLLGNCTKCPAYRLIALLFVLLVHGALQAQPGSFDDTFGTHGKVNTGFGGSEVRFNTIAVQPDGKIICAGSAYTSNTTREFEGDSYNSVLYRYNIDGSTDSTFGINGQVKNTYPSTSNEYRIYTGIYDILILESGKILTYGYIGVNAQYGGLLMCRYNADGSIDSTFGNSGFVDSPVTPNSTGILMVEQPDHKVVILGGQYTSSTSSNTATFYMQRFNENGTLDTTYGINGEVFTTFGYAINYPACLALQDDGKILASGTANGRNVIARYNLDGSLDTSFDGDGKVVTAFGQSQANYFMTTLPGGKIQLAGLLINANGLHFSISQYNSNGSLDTSFDGDGRTLSLFEASDNSFAFGSIFRQSDGKYLVSTTTQNVGYSLNTDDFMVRRYNADGTVDTAFGLNGKVATDLNASPQVGKYVFGLDDGRILFAGYSGSVNANLLCYTESGNLDTSFSEDGVISESIETTNDNGRIVLIQNDGKILVIGVQRYNIINQLGSSNIAISRYTADGLLDNTFGENGKTVLPYLSGTMTVRKASLQPDGKIIVLYEYYDFPNTTGQKVMRFNSDGSEDNSFGINGRTVISSNLASNLCALHVKEDGSFLVINHGYSPIDQSEPFAFYLTAFDSNGILNTSFGEGGTVFKQGAFYSGFDPEIRIQPDGKIIFSSYEQLPNFFAGIALTRFNADGSIDDTFINEPLTVDVGSAPFNLFLEPDGRILVAGINYENVDSYTFLNFITIAYHANGNLDTSYGTNGVIKTYLGDQAFAVYSQVKSVLRQSDGKFLVGLTRYETNPAYPQYQDYDFALYRINAGGGYDLNFGDGGKVFTSFFEKYDELFSLALQSDNKIIMAGTTDNGITRDFAIARLENCLNVSSEINVSLCAGEVYNWQNENYDESGMYQVTLISTSGCDSLVTLHLDIQPEVSFSQNISLCPGETYSINNNTYSESGIYEDVFSNLQGCDSTVTTVISVDPIAAIINANDASLFATGFLAGNTFQWLNCNNDLLPINGATNEVYTPTTDGSYAFIVSNGTCSATSSCIEFSVTNVTALNSRDNAIGLYPNPVRDQFTLDVSAIGLPCSYHLYDMQGKEIGKGFISQKQSVISIDHISSGIYQFTVENNTGKKETIRLVKE